MSYNALRNGRFSHGGREYLVTAVTAGRTTVFREFCAARMLANALRDTEELNLAQWLAWVIMPDHFHGLVALREQVDLARLMQRVKGRTAHRLNVQRGVTGQVWQPAFHDHALRSEEDRAAVAWYIVNNPVRAGLVANVMDYPHWDSVWVSEWGLALN